MIVMPIGKMAPAPIPWMARAPISDGIDQAMPHSSDPRMKTTTPNVIIGTG